MDNKLSSHAHKVTHSLIQVTKLWNLHLLKNQLLQVIKLCTEPKVLQTECLARPLDGFAPLRDLIVDPLIVLVKRIKLIREVLGHIRGFTEHLTRQCLNLLNASWSSGLLFNTEIIPKLVLILLLQKVNQEFASSKHLRFQNRGQEFLIVNLLLMQLLPIQLFLLIHDWQRWDDDLRVFLDQVVPQLDEIDIKSLNLPAHWMGLHHNHKRLSPDDFANFWGNELVHVGDVNLRVCLLVQHRQLGLTSANWSERVAGADATDGVVELFVFLFL